MKKLAMIIAMLVTASIASAVDIEDWEGTSFAGRDSTLRVGSNVGWFSGDPGNNELT